MAIIFHGDVTVYGNVETYSNGSMKITHISPLTIPLTELEQFIERSLKDSPNKEDYLKATDVLKNSRDTKAIQKSTQKLKGIVKEIGRNILISGLSNVVIEAMKAL